MKLLIVIFAIATIVKCGAAEWIPKSQAEIKSISNQCAVDYPISKENFLKLKSFEFPDVETVRILILCTVKRLEVFDAEGFHVDRIIKLHQLQMDETEANEIAAKCADKNEQKSSEDVWAFRAHSCLINTNLGTLIREVVNRTLI